MFVPGAAAPKLERLSLVGGFGRLFSWQSLVGLAKTSLLAILLAIVGGSYVATHLDRFASLAGEGSARAVAESSFDARVVLSRLLEDIGGTA